MNSRIISILFVLTVSVIVAVPVNAFAQKRTVTITPSKYTKEVKKTSNEILFVADNQQAQVLTYPIREQSNFAEKTVGTAHRRPALDEFAISLIDWIHNHETKKSSVLIHVGDLINNSCVEEYEYSEKVLNGLSLEWYLTPGNHDGFYLGISSPLSWKGAGVNGILDERRGWAQACTYPTKLNKDELNKNEKNRQIIDKYAFVSRYLKTLGIQEFCKQDSNNCDETVGNISNDMRYVCQHISSNIGKALPKRKSLRAVCWSERKGANNRLLYNDHVNINSDQLIEREPWRHFVLQLISVPIGHTKDKQNILIIDTASYKTNYAVDKTGEFILNARAGAADNASFNKLQYEAALELAEKEGYNIALIVGHHPIEDIDKKSLGLLAKLIKKIRESSKSHPNEYDTLYVSGDTHNGYDVIHKIGNDDIGSVKIREANIGSIIDAPIEYATLGLTDKKIVIDRYMMTPWGKKHGWSNEDFKKSKLKRRNNTNLPEERIFKTYAKKASTWDLCATKFTIKFDEFNRNSKLELEDSKSDPLGIGAPLIFPPEMALKQPDYYLSVPYWLNLFRMDDVRTLSLNVYKLNRLMLLANVYQQLMKYTGMLDNESQDIKTLKSIAKNEIMNARNSNFFLYSRDSKALNKALEDMEMLIKEYRKMDFSSKEAILFKVCAALSESEREY